ncbi:MAG: hypothetical protein AAF645_30200, partial [Myxococcota bacterium]
RPLHPLESALVDAEGVTLLRAGYFLENLRSFGEALGQGVLTTYWSPETPIEWLDTVTIGERAAELLLSGGPSTVQLTGEAAAPFSAFAEALTAVLGHEVRSVSMAADAIIEPLQGMGAGEIATMYAEMNRAMDTGAIAFEDALPVERRGPSLEACLRRVLAPSGR